VGREVNVSTGVNVVGEKGLVAKGLKDLVVPLIVEDIYDAMKAQGVTDATTMAVLSILGMSSQTYGPMNDYRNADAAGRKEQFENDLESMKWNSPPPAYAEFLTADQMKQVDSRREEKKRSVIEGATQNPPDRKKHISDATYNDSLKKREKALETFKAMKETVSFEQAKQLLKDYYRYQKVSADGRPLGSIIDQDSKYGNVKPEYLARMRLLRRLYGQ